MSSYSCYHSTASDIWNKSHLKIHPYYIAYIANMPKT